jgi:hypothetical protein
MLTITITITPRAVFLAALIALAVVLAFYTTDALGSSQPEAYIQGDTNCDGIIDAEDALNDLRYTAGLDVGPFPNCPAIGSEAAIPGPQGPAGISGLELVSTSSSTDSTDLKLVTAPCPDGKQTIGGGATIVEPVEGIAALTSSSPLANLGGWTATAEEVLSTGSNWRIEAYAICANVAE